jgi:hypothetical protein
VAAPPVAVPSPASISISMSMSMSMSMSLRIIRRLNRYIILFKVLSVSVDGVMGFPTILHTNHISTTHDAVAPKIHPMVMAYHIDVAAFSALDRGVDGRCCVPVDYHRFTGG